MTTKVAAAHRAAPENWSQRNYSAFLSVAKGFCVSEEAAV